jgi:CBS domain-containing protein
MMTIKTVSEVMSDDIYAFAQDTSIETAARVLTTRSISGAPVLSPSGKPVGVVTMADLVDPDRPRTQRNGYPLFYHLTDSEIEEIGDDILMNEGQVADVMSPFVLSIGSTATLIEASNRMISERVHRLLVMDDTRLVGVVTTLDLLRGFVMQTI